MIEQWVIDKLNSLNGEKLVILSDPQRTIRAGARAVDGWAKRRGAAHNGEHAFMSSMVAS